MRIFLTAMVIALVAALPLRAQTAAHDDIARLAQALKLRETVAIMRDEGLEYGDEIARAMFPSRADGQWRAEVARLNDEAWMLDTVMEGFRRVLQGVDVAPLLDFFESPLGARIVGLEISARVALNDDAIEAANTELVNQRVAANDSRIAQIRAFIEANDLIEMNVAGTLNSDYAFYLGLQDGGAFDPPKTESEILSEVWSGEPSIRSDTTDWLLGFLYLAYSPLSDEELQSYTDLSLTPAGVKMNAALFAGFDAMFEEISSGLGRAAGRLMSSDEL